MFCFALILYQQSYLQFDLFNIERHMCTYHHSAQETYSCIQLGLIQRYIDALLFQEYITYTLSVFEVSGYNMMESFSSLKYKIVQLHYRRYWYSNVPCSVYVQEAVIPGVRIQPDWRWMHAMPQRQLDPHTMSTAGRYVHRHIATPRIDHEHNVHI